MAVGLNAQVVLAGQDRVMFPVKPPGAEAAIVKVAVALPIRTVVAEAVADSEKTAAPVPTNDTV
jgi:hypothetical protein